MFQFTPSSSLTAITKLYADKISSTKLVNNEKIIVATQEHYTVIRRSLKQLELIYSPKYSSNDYSFMLPFTHLLKLISNNYLGLVDVRCKETYDNKIHLLSYFTGSIQTRIHSRLVQLIEYITI